MIGDTMTSEGIGRVFMLAMRDGAAVWPSLDVPPTDCGEALAYVLGLAACARADAWGEALLLLPDRMFGPFRTIEFSHADAHDVGGE